jgi:hypothetical protein
MHRHRESNNDDVRRQIVTRRNIFSLILAIGIMVSLPYAVCGADRVSRGSRSLRSPKVPRQHFQRFGRFGFWGAEGFGEQQVIIVQQVQPAPKVKPKEPATDKIFVPPRWVDAGHGVQVSQPGYWVEAKQGAKR